MRLKAGSGWLMFERTDTRKNPRMEFWEAVRATGPSRSHRYTVWTYDGGESWTAELTVRAPHSGKTYSDWQKHDTPEQALAMAYGEYRKAMEVRYG